MYDTISDVIIHLKYTAREGGFNLKTIANEALVEQLESISKGLSQDGLHIAINMRHDAAGEWHLLKQDGAADLAIDHSRLPYMAQSPDAEIESVMFLARVEGNPASFTVNVDGTPVNLARQDDLGLCTGVTNDIELGTTFTLSVAEADKDNLLDLMMMVKYKL